MNCKALDHPRHYKIDRRYYRRDVLISACTFICKALIFRYLIDRCEKYICGVSVEVPTTTTEKQSEVVSPKTCPPVTKTKRPKTTTIKEDEEVPEVGDESLPPTEGGSDSVTGEPTEGEATGGEATGDEASVYDYTET